MLSTKGTHRLNVLKNTEQLFVIYVVVYPPAVTTLEKGGCNDVGSLCLHPGILVMPRGCLACR